MTAQRHLFTPPVTDANTSYLCACGCGEEINPLVRKADEGVARGLTHRQIALRHQVTREYVSRMLRPGTRPRFVKGHGAQRGHRLCAGCGESFYSMGPNHIYCSGSARSRPRSDACARLSATARDKKWREFDEDTATRTAERVIKRDRALLVKAQARLERRLERVETVQYPDMALNRLEKLPAVLETSVIQALAPPPALLYSHAEQTLTKIVAAHRQSVQAELGVLIATFTATVTETKARRLRDKGRDLIYLHAWREREEAAARAVAKQDPALAALMAEQARDRTWGDRIDPWKPERSLDARIKGEWGSLGPERGETTGGHDLFIPRIDDPADLLIDEEMRDLLYRVTGGMELEDVYRLDGHSLARLQDKLAEAHLIDISVQASERDRLRAPAKHSGHGISRAPLIPGRKTRKQKIAHKQANRNKGNSNRPKQKPRKRWTRT